MATICIAVWCVCLIFFSFTLNDFAIVGLLLIAITVYIIGYAESQQVLDLLILLSGVTLGKLALVVLRSANRKNETLPNAECRMGDFLIGLVALLALSSWWHFDLPGSYYRGPRWTGLWDDPNTYGILMSAGLLLAMGMFASELELKVKNPKSILFLVIAFGTTAAGLIFSYSRGAWLGTVIGLLYLAKAYGKFKWWFLWLPTLAAVAIIGIFWNTPRTAAWYLQRLDFSRGSVQHRLAAWKAGLKIMRDHPFGVGWNETIKTYYEHYSPPEGGVVAIKTNDYLMIGTQLGSPALFFFLVYVALCFRSKPRTQELRGPIVACRAGVVAMLIEFWFDGGLFKLATASVFWILLELGRTNGLPELRPGSTELAGPS